MLIQVVLVFEKLQQGDLDVAAFWTYFRENHDENSVVLKKDFERDKIFFVKI